MCSELATYWPFHMAFAISKVQLLNSFHQIVLSMVNIVYSNSFGRQKLCQNCNVCYLHSQRLFKPNGLLKALNREINRINLPVMSSYEVLKVVLPSFANDPAEKRPSREFDLNFRTSHFQFATKRALSVKQTRKLS